MTEVGFSRMCGHRSSGWIEVEAPFVEGEGLKHRLNFRA
jgi:hypothetical protein